MEFHEKLKQLREALKMSQIDIAEKIGVAKSTYSLYESGKREPNVQKIKQIALALQTTPDELLGIRSESPLVLSENEQEYIKKFRMLDIRGKQAVGDTLEREFSYIKKSGESILKDMAEISKGLTPQHYTIEQK